MSEEMQACRRCADLVYTLSTDGLCDGCVEEDAAKAAATAEDVRLRGIVRAQARFLRWIADNYKGVDLDIVRARANELDALAARGEAS